MDWGNHNQLTSTTHIIFHPSKCYIKESRLVFAVENQWVFFWGIKISDIKEDNPPVYYAYNVDTTFEWNLIHQKTSQFIDWLLFGHAFHDESNPFSGGFGLIGASDGLSTFLESKIFNLIQLASAPWRLRLESEERPWRIYYIKNLY